tara:strand:- start:174 stop:434 length:261 start_codon:yes stop_codon:yes gene_type:complete
MPTKEVLKSHQTKIIAEQDLEENIILDEKDYNDILRYCAILRQQIEYLEKMVGNLNKFKLTMKDIKLGNENNSYVVSSQKTRTEWY